MSRSIELSNQQGRFGDNVSDAVAVVMTCHNRRETTLRCLESLYGQVGGPKFKVFLVDDGSSDDTGAAVSFRFPEVEVLPGTGQLYWGGGTRLAMERALRGDFRAFLWLNDDVVLDESALRRLSEVQATVGGMCVVGGSMRAPGSAAAVYGGSIRNRRHPFAFSLVQPLEEQVTAVDVVHGNVVWIGADAATRVGLPAEYLTHLAGDYEYCLRATKLGVGVVLAPGTYGTCTPNPVRERQRGWNGVRRALSVKEMPLSAAVPLYKNYCGPFWWAWLAAYYVKAWVVGVR